MAQDPPVNTEPLSAVCLVADHCHSESLYDYSSEQRDLCLLEARRNPYGWHVDNLCGGLWLADRLVFGKQNFDKLSQIQKSRLVDNISQRLHKWLWENEWGFTYYLPDKTGRWKARQCPHLSGLIKGAVRERLELPQQLLDHSIGLLYRLHEHGQQGCDQARSVHDPPDFWADVVGDYGESVQWTD